MFLVWNFLNLAIFLEKNEKNSATSPQKKKKKNQKFEITNFKEKMLLLMSKFLKIIIIIPTLNI
jgi:hypothetical protein